MSDSIRQKALLGTLVALLLLGLFLGPRMVRDAKEAEQGRSAEQAAGEAKWAVDADARKRGIAAVVDTGGTIKSARYEDSGRRLVATAVQDDGTRRDPLAQWACQVLREAEAVSAEEMTITIVDGHERVLGRARCAHHTLPWRD